MSRAWRVERSEEAATARAVAGPGATVQALADRVGLDAAEFPHWLGLPTGRVVLADGTAAEIAGLTAASKIRAGEEVTVPNAVFLLWVGELGWFGRAFVRRAGDEAYLRRLGFQPVLHDAAEVDAARWLEEIGSAGDRRELHGLFVTGHGLAHGFGAVAWHEWNVTYRDLVGDGVTTGRLRYRLGLVVINACLSDYCRADTVFRAPARLLGFGPRWRSTPLPAGTTIEAGARDLVARSPAARFFGVKGILNPVVTTCHVWDLIRPGDQASRPS